MFSVWCIFIMRCFGLVAVVLGACFSLRVVCALDKLFCSFGLCPVACLFLFYLCWCLRFILTFAFGFVGC